MGRDRRKVRARKRRPQKPKQPEAVIRLAPRPITAATSNAFMLTRATSAPVHYSGMASAMYYPLPERQVWE